VGGNPREFLRTLRRQLRSEAPHEMQLAIVEGLAALEAMVDTMGTGVPASYRHVAPSADPA